MERRKRSITCISLSPSNTTFTHTLSFTLIAKLTRRRSKHKATTILKIRKQQLAKALDIPLWRTPGGIYRHQGKGGQGDNPWSKAQAQPRPYGRENVARAAFSLPCPGGARLAACCVWLRLSSVSWIFWFVDLISWADKIFSLRSMATW